MFVAWFIHAVGPVFDEMGKTNLQYIYSFSLRIYWDKYVSV